MPYVYQTSLATAGVVTTNGSGNTENNTFSVKAGATRSVGIMSFFSVGRANAATTISGIVHRFLKWTTASTAGTAMNALPNDTGVPAITATPVSAATNGSTRTNGIVVGHGAAGPGGWVAENADAIMTLPAGNASSYDALNACAAASLTFEYSLKLQET